VPDILLVGLRQLSDFCEERVPSTISKTLRNALGSISAGVISGYLSHVPHNLSTLKLMNPSRSYGDLFRQFAQAREKLLPESWSPSTRRSLGALFSVVAPAGLHIRTGQICGSFVIINGIINIMTSRKKAASGSVTDKYSS